MADVVVGQVVPESTGVNNQAADSLSVSPLQAGQVILTQPANDVIQTVDLAPSQKYILNFSADNVEVAFRQQGDLIVNFNNGSSLVLRDFDAAMADTLNGPSFAMVGVGSMNETSLMANLGVVNQPSEDLLEEPLAGIRQSELQVSGDELAGLSDAELAAQVANIAPAAGIGPQLLQAEQLAAIEPEAGGAAAGAGGTSSGFGFGSSFSPTSIVPLNAIGPIGPTALVFGLNQPVDQPIDILAAAAPFSFDPAVEVSDSFVLEDNSVQLNIEADPQLANGDMEIVISGIPNTWTVTGPGTYDPVAETWTITTTGGVNFTGGPILQPPLNSDVDLPGLVVTVTETDPVTGDVNVVTESLDVIVDAVADVPNISAAGGSGVEDNAVALNIQTSLNDTDGSEVITQVVISDVPAGFSFIDALGNPVGAAAGAGAYAFNVNDLSGLQIVPPANYSGSIDLTVTSFVEEQNFSGVESIFNNNNAQNATQFTVNWSAVPDQPVLIVSDAQVKEDGIVFVPVQANLVDTDGSEFLTVTVTNIPAGVTITSNDLVETAPGVWQVTLPAGQNFSGGFFVTPPDDSDVDITNISVSARSTELSNNTSATASANIDVVVDAVADGPDVIAQDRTVAEGQTIAVDLQGFTGEAVNGSANDGSETITGYQISGVPSGFSFNQGTDLGGGVWSFTPAQIAGLTLTPPNGTYNGTINLTASVFTTENPVSDGEFDPSDNNAQDSDIFTLSWSPTIIPPTITVEDPNDPNDTPLGTDVASGGRVKEDGSVDIEINANLDANAAPSEQLTVTLSGIDPSWGFSSAVGTYNAAAGTWTYTGALGQNITQIVTFSPPADSDIDLTGLRASVSTTDTATGQNASGTPQDFSIIVDAVIDGPDITANNAAVAEGQTIAVDLQGFTGEALNGGANDGSETITGYQISGVPSGFSFNQGTDLGGGVWSFTPAQIAGLTLTPPNGTYNGTINLTATVFTTENPVSDGEFDPSDNNAQDSDIFTLSWSPTIDPPTILVNGGADNTFVKEDGSVDVDLVANLSNNAAPGEYLTVTVTGIPSNWGFVAPIGSYNAANGTWSYQVPAGQNLSTTFTFSPPADSDLDISGLRASVTATDPATSQSAGPVSDNFGIIVDAVADAPTLNVTNASGEEGTSISLNIGTAVTDVDGSEVIERIEISNLPPGATLSAGTNNGGVWTLSPAQLANLQLSLPDNQTGVYDLRVQSYSFEQNLGGTEYDLTDNRASTVRTLRVTVSDDSDPQIVNLPRLDVDETDFGVAPTGRDSDSGQITADFGADGPAAVPFELLPAPSFPGLTSNGNTVTVSVSGDKYVGAANNQVVFELQINRLTGAYNFTLFGNLDHPDATNPNDIIQLGFGVRATDGDGDHVTGTIQVRVFDDGPQAADDFGSIAQGQSVQSGNVMNNDDIGEDTFEAGITQIEFNGNTVNLNGGSATINGLYGTLQINDDGSYTYTKTVNNTSDVTDVFTYTLADGDNDTVTADLSITSAGTPAPTPGLLIVGTNVDDQGGSNTPWEVGNGRGTINGSAGNDVLVGDSGGVCDVNIGRDYNLLFMIDTSSSMGSQSNPNSNFSLMIEAISDQIAQIGALYNDGAVRVHFAPYGEVAGAGATFDIDSPIGMLNALNYLDNLSTGGFTNFEAGMQSGISWLQSNNTLPNATTQSFFFSDGAPNRYTNNGGQSVQGDQQTIINELNGTRDGSNEIDTLKSLSDEVISVGIKSGDVPALGLIDSDGVYRDISDENEFQITLNGTNIITKLLASGCDVINGGNGEDLIFGDVLYTDNLASAQGLNTEAGSGWEVFARLENGEGSNAGWDRQDTIEYIKNNADALSRESIDAQGNARGYENPNAGHDVLNGGAGNDIIFGQEGDDLITGGAGDDVLIGGSGRDAFIYNGNDGRDSILDFGIGDVLDISGLLNGFDPLQDSINNFVFKTEVGGNTIISVDASGTGNASNAVEIAVLEGVTGMNIIDIVNNGQAA